MATASNPIELTAVERLGQLLKQLNISEAYYIDDYNGIDNLPIIQAISKMLYNNGNVEDLKLIYGEYIDLNVPGEDELGREIEAFWLASNGEQKDEVLANISKGREEHFSKLDFDRSHKLQALFPAGELSLISPDEWDEVFPKLVARYTNDEKVLILFDQDLSMANGERYRNKTTQGQDLILQVMKSDIGKNVFCALISHLVQDTSKEIDERDNIITSSGNVLSKTDFLALAKERIEDAESFCDGIKKTLLNGSFEVIKEKSKKIIVEAHENAIVEFEKLDTYDFDHTILQSSYVEGIWEANTIFRIIHNLFEEKVKQIMIDSKYPKIINPLLKSSKNLSDIQFSVPLTQPYIAKYKLRHNDIYEGANINKLHAPIENGDIFQITEGTGRGYYILIGQECDLAIRSNGKRFDDIATIVKITIVKKSKLLEDLKNSDHHFSNKFPLYYFEAGTTDVGIVNFNNVSDVILDVLDLCVYNEDGIAKLDITSQFDSDLLNISLENRYSILTGKCKSVAAKLEIQLNEIAKIPGLTGELRDQLHKKLYPNLGAYNPLGIVKSYNSNIFNFGIKREMRLKSFSAKYLLDRYYRHKSRTAEPHDFAELKIK